MLHLPRFAVAKPVNGLHLDRVRHRMSYVEAVQPLRQRLFLERLPLLKFKLAPRPLFEQFSDSRIDLYYVVAGTVVAGPVTYQRPEVGTLAVFDFDNSRSQSGKCSLQPPNIFPPPLPCLYLSKSGSRQTGCASQDRRCVQGAYIAPTRLCQPDLTWDQFAGC